MAKSLVFTTQWITLQEESKSHLQFADLQFTVYSSMGLLSNLSYTYDIIHPHLPARLLP